MSRAGNGTFSPAILRIDAPQVAERIERAIRQQTLSVLRRRGAVVGLSGGVDSSVVATLCARALGRERVIGLLMPDRDSSPESLELGRALAEQLGIRHVAEDITPALEALGCYQRQVAAIRTAFPDYGEGWRCKLTLPSLLEADRLNLTMLTVADPSGARHRSRLSSAAYLQLVAAASFKQRVRAMFEYYHADCHQYAVVGTSNLLEHDQGFFVKQGDGAADLKPIAHLYKTQVFALAEHLGVPAAIRAREPTTDTFSLPQTQEEFYFGLPFEQMDLCLWGLDHGLPADVVAPAAGLTAPQVQRVYRDIEAKRRATRYLHRAPLLADEPAEG